MPTGTGSIVTHEVDGRIVNSFLATKGELDLMIKLEIPAALEEGTDREVRGSRWSNDSGGKSCRLRLLLGQLTPL
jgi:hypothetical protein